MKSFQIILLLLITLFPMSYVSSQELPENLDKLVKNPELLKAMDKLATDDSKAAKMNLMSELNKANYLVPVLSEELNKNSADDKGMISLNKNSDIKVLSMSDGRGNQFMPVFTDIGSAEKWSTDKEFKTIAMPAEKVWKFVLSKNEYDGVVVNPGKKALPLKKDAIRYLNSKSK